LFSSSHFPGGQFQPFSKGVCFLHFPGGNSQRLPFSKWSISAIFRWSAPAIFQVVNFSHFPGGQFQPLSKRSSPAIFKVVSFGNFPDCQLQLVSM
jgi:hypothetical protein